MNKITVEIDKAEKRPFRFPEMFSWRGEAVVVAKERVHMRTGDYRLKKFPQCLIERKGGPMELYSCVLGKDRPRFLKQMERLKKEAAWPVLFIDCAPQEILAFDYGRYIQVSDPWTGSRLLTKTAEITAGIGLVWMGRVDTVARLTEAGSMALATMLGVAEKALSGGLTKEAPSSKLLTAVERVLSEDGRDERGSPEGAGVGRDEVDG